MGQLINKIIEKFHPFLYTYDYEHVLIILLLILLFVIGLKKSTVNSQVKGFFLDHNFSGALKGIGVIFILMGHFANMMQYGANQSVDGGDKSINWIISWSTANIGLVWFMFISGYGLSVKRKKIDNYFLTACKRLGKVFFPMLFVFLVSLVVYCFMPYIWTPKEGNALAIPKEVGMLPAGLIDNLGFISSEIINWYWYPWCAIMLYVCFYLAYHLSDRFNINKSYALLAVLAVYYIGAFFILGPSLAHYYRLVWAFYFGHLFAIKPELSKKQFYILAAIAISTLYYEDVFMILSFAIALAIILLCGHLNKHYTFNSKPILFMGTVSYYYYLCHRRIVWPLQCELGIYDLLVWTLLSIILAFVLYRLYNSISSLNSSKNTMR